MLRSTISTDILLGVVSAGLMSIVGIAIALQSSPRAIAAPDHGTTSAIFYAQTLNNGGIRQLEAGQAEAALETWRQAEAAYTRAGDKLGKLGSQLNQVQALQTLGQYRRARTLLEQINTQLQTLPNSPLKAGGLRSLGIVLLRIGDLTASQKVLKSSLEISQRLNTDTSSTLLALGNVARAKQDDAKTNSSASTEAIAFYQQAATSTLDNPIRLQARLNLLSLLVESNQHAQAFSLLPEIQTLLADLPSSRTKVYAQVNLAESLIKAGFTKPYRSLSFPTAIAQLLANTVQQARDLQDLRAEAYALGQLGHLYETSKQWSEAEQLTRQALQIAQSIPADDIAVSWYWQLGRILKQQGQTSEAIAAYNQAVETLSVLRSDLVAINPEAQFSFREQVEPIYRELVQLLLDNNPNQANLERARSVIEALQLAELNNFFREACLDTQPQPIDQVDPQAAVVYSIILRDRLAVILSLPNQPLQYRSTPLTLSSDRTAEKNQAGEIDRTYEDLFATLSPFITGQEPLRPHQQLYDWLIRPIEADLAKSRVKTIVFVLDGVLRGVPLAALHDGQQYLIEKYSLALTPELQLLPPQPLAPEQLGILAGGLSQARQGFSALPGVAEEIQQISTLMPTSILLDQSFTRSQLARKLTSVPFPIVHLATHGQFSSQSENTFLLTWEGRIKVKDLDQLLEVRDRQNRQPIELLILSACQTAKGDKQAALGLAGIAVRSGARSTIATLWSVQDDSTTELITHFYTALKQPGISRAEALRQAQLSLLRSPNYQHPYYWAPFVLVGNWQ
ncbi:CHAT domain-containing protein [Trichocoleus sp. FACHB-591]|uniref:CHAT domain-containing protein n=1 Tax=Trichocoleus sp. FACHB-591 TaxID=2692872 RepID=UPI00168A0EFA|nr:CHAT domain-containing protein [Trichocoleus sp. FACHB-591]MBD2095612.1 CHAT domain-containing protein [Trichocoleus sp. FACHB-591]